MNVIAALGLLAAVGVMIFGILLGSPLAIFFDVGALLIVPFTTVLLLGATYGFGTVFRTLGSGFLTLYASRQDPADPAEVRQLEAVAESGIKYATLTGFIGTLIGLVSMLANLEDPTAIGPAMAVCLLSAFYAGGSIMLVFYPLARHAAQQALAIPAER